MSAKGFGATVSGSTHQGSSTTASNRDQSMSVFLVGGRGDAIPKNKQELEAKLETLSYAAYEAPKDFRMAVTPYELLPNWPQTKELRGSVSEFDQLAGTWGDYNTLYDEIEHILDRPYLYAAVVLDEGKYATVPLLPNSDEGKGQILYLERLQDYVHQSLRELEAVARSCVSAEETQIDEGRDCLFDETQYLSGYAFRSQLPVDARIDENFEAPAKCEPMPEKEPALTDCRKAYAQAVTAHLAGLPRPLDRLVAEQWIIPKSQGRCRFDVLDLVCLANAEVRHWQSKVGQRLTLARSAGERELMKRAGVAYDEGTGAVWTSALQEQAVLAALRPQSAP